MADMLSTLTDFHKIERLLEIANVIAVSEESGIDYISENWLNEREYQALFFDERLSIFDYDETFRKHTIKNYQDFSAIDRDRYLKAQDIFSHRLAQVYSALNYSMLFGVPISDKSSIDIHVEHGNVNCFEASQAGILSFLSRPKLWNYVIIPEMSANEIEFVCFLALDVYGIIAGRIGLIEEVFGCRVECAKERIKEVAKTVFDRDVDGGRELSDFLLAISRRYDGESS